MIQRLLLLAPLLLLSLGACSKDNEQDTEEADADTDADTDADADADTDTDTDLVDLATLMVNQSACHASGTPSLSASDVGGGDIEVDQVNFRFMSTCPDFEVRAALDTRKDRIMVQLKNLQKPCKGECYLDLTYRILDLEPGDYVVMAPGGQAPVTVH